MLDPCRPLEAGATNGTKDVTGTADTGTMETGKAAGSGNTGTMGTTGSMETPGTANTGVVETDEIAETVTRAIATTEPSPWLGSLP